MTKQESQQVSATIAHLNAQTAKLTVETKWYVIALLFGGGSAFTLAILAVFKYLFT